MTIGREQSDFSQGDLVFRGRIRVPTSGRIDHLRHLQDRAEFQRRLDAVEELRKALTRLFALPGATEGTEGYRHPLNNPPAKSDYTFGALMMNHMSKFCWQIVQRKFGTGMRSTMPVS